LDRQNPNTKYFKKDNTTHFALFTGLDKEIEHKQTINQVVQIIQHKWKMVYFLSKTIKLLRFKNEVFYNSKTIWDKIKKYRDDTHPQNSRV